MPTISVVIPTYNRLRFLREALESVFWQTYAPAEILVVDDGSTDGTAAAVHALADKRIRYIQQKNAGPSAARNRGMREASSDWIAFLDSDDVWLPHRLERQCHFLAAHGEALDFLFGNQVNLEGGVTAAAPEILNRGVYARLQATPAPVPDIFELLLQVNPIPTSSVLFRKAVLTQVGFFDENRWRCEDYDLWLRFARHTRVGFVDEVLVAKRRQDDNLINDYMKLWSAYLEVLRELPRKNPDLLLTANRIWRRAVAHTIYRLGSFQLSRGDTREAARWLEELNCRDLAPFRSAQVLGLTKRFLLRTGWRTSWSRRPAFR